MSKDIKITPPYITDALKIEQRLHKYFYSPALISQLIQFSYLINPANQVLCAHVGLTNYLGYPPELNSLADMWHPNEKNKLLRLEQEIMNFAKKHDIPNGDFGISMVNHMRKADGNYIQVWRHIYPLLSDEVNDEMVCAYCMDITPYHFNDKITFKVVKSAGITFDLEMAEDHFSKVLSEEEVRFTERQLEVLRVWSELDSSKTAAERLNMKVRTLETHLKNVRKRLKVRRTMDAVLYAKEHGWL